MSRWDNTGTSKRLINQYADSPNLKALIDALVDMPAGDVRAALESLYRRLNIDLMSGVQLDRIGYIVGQKRPDSFSPIFVGSDPETAFTFLDGANDTGKGFSAIGRDDIGGQFVGLEPNQQMLDPAYRILLKAAIYRNVSGATIPEIEEYSQLVLGVAANVLNGFTYIDVQFQKPLSAQERAIIEATLKPAAGIRIRYLSFGRGENAFGFAGRDGNSGFGGVGAEQDGDGFVRLFGSVA